MATFVNIPGDPAGTFDALAFDALAFDVTTTGVLSQQLAPFTQAATVSVSSTPTVHFTAAQQLAPFTQVATVVVTAAGSGGGWPPGALGTEFGPSDKRRKSVSFKPLLQRVLEARYPRVRPAKDRAAKRAKVLEVEAARLIVEDPGAVHAFDALMARWANEGAAAPAGIDLRGVFEAQVGFRMRQLQLEQAARQALAEQRARDEDDVLMALLLA